MSLEAMSYECTINPEWGTFWFMGSILLKLNLSQRLPFPLHTFADTITREYYSHRERRSKKHVDE